MPSIDKAIIGAAGEHLVLSRLLSRGFLAAQAPRGVRKVDILVNFLDGGAPCLIQVKTTMRGSRGWVMQARHEGIEDPDLFYCFVDFEPEYSTVHVIPAAVVARTLARGHALWLATPGREGKPHIDNPIRSLSPTSVSNPSGWMDQYLENWVVLTAQP